MKKMLVIAAGWACISAGAQTANFEGFSAAVNLNAVAAGSKFSANIEGPSTVDGLGQQSWNGGIQAAYGLAIGPGAVLSIGGTYTLGSSKGGEIVGLVQTTMKNAYSAYLEPGFMVGDRTLAYGKISYEGAKGVLAGGGEEVSKTITGTGFGFGLRTMLDKSAFMQVEIKQVTYTNVDLDGASFKPRSTVGSVGIGLKF